MDAVMETECEVLEERFHNVLFDMKTSFSIWDDFTTKAGRLHTALKTTAIYSTAFLESFQKLADAATSSRGSTRDIGSAMTRLCLRHRNIDSRLKGFTAAIMDSLVVPVQERMDDWKRTVAILDREHTKEYKKTQQEVKKASAEMQRLQKKVKKGKNECRAELDRAIQEGNEKLALLHSLQKNAVKAAVVEERRRLCLFISCLKPVMDEEVAMLTEVTHVQEILHSLCMLAGDPEVAVHSSSADPIVHDLTEVKADTGPSGKSVESEIVTKTITLGSPSSGGSMTSSGGSIGGGTPLYSPVHVTQYQQQHQRAQSQVFPSKFTAGPDAEESTAQMVISADGKMVRSVEFSSGGMEKGGAGEDVKLGPTGSILRRQRDNSGAHADRPHTISAAYEKALSRPRITSETYLPPSDGSSPASSHQAAVPQYLRTQSYTAAPASLNNSSHYAVPCIMPTRKQSGVKIADIYARPSLIPASSGGGGGGYRTPSNRPLPVATPTVPDFEPPPFPVAGYVNMNQLANLALQQHQIEQYNCGAGGDQKKGAMSGREGQKEFVGGGGDRFLYDTETHGQVHDGRYHEAANRQSYSGSDRHQMMVRDASAALPSSTGSEMDLHAIAERLEYASRLSSVDKYCTLSRQPRHMLSSSTTGITSLYTNAKLVRDPALAANSACMNNASRTLPSGSGVRGYPPSEEGSSDRDSPDFN